MQLLCSCLASICSSVQLEVQLVVPNGQFQSGRQLLEILGQGDHFEFRHARVLFEPFIVFDHVVCRTAAAVAVAKGGYCLIVNSFILEVLPCAKNRFWIKHSVVTPERVIEEMADYFTAIQPPPQEEVERETILLIPLQLGRRKVFYSRFFHDLRKYPGEAKDIRKPCHRRSHTELLFEEHLAV